MTRAAAFAVLTLTLAASAARGPAPQPRLAMSPKKPSEGSLVELTVDRLAGGDSIVGGTMAGEPLHFRDATIGAQPRLEALAAIPLNASDSVVARVVVAHASGDVDTLRLFLKYPHRPPPPPAPVTPSRSRIKRAPSARRLRVDPRFTRALDSATNARIEQENDSARDLGRRAQDTPSLWTLPFLKPRTSKVTSRFGAGRVFNGRVQSSHVGIDYRGKLGEPVVAANRGVVALVGDFFLAGNVVYVDHGDGIVTGYFHLSEVDVAQGDTVERGQEIGLVGATGRVTGPHLHWSARFGALTIDPADLLALRPPFVEVDVEAAGKR